MALLGIYSQGSWTTHEKCSFEEFNQAIEYLFEKQSDESDGLFFYGTVPKLPPSFLTDDEILFYANCYLTAIHERTHFLQSVSTPFGLFQARCSMTKAALLRLLFRELKESKWLSNGGHVYLPLHQWHKFAKGIDEHLFHILDEKLKYIKNIEDLENVFFFNGNFDYNNIEINLTTAQHFIAVGSNRSFGIDPFHDIPKFKNKQIPHFNMIQDRKITSPKIFESYAKFLEEAAVGKLKLPNENLQQSLPAQYDKRYYLIALQCIEDLYPGVNASTMLAILDYSLFTVADPLFHELWDSEMYVEDLVPVCRMLQIIEKAREYKLKVEKFNFLDFYEKMAEILEWPSPELILKTMSSINFYSTPVTEQTGSDGPKRSIVEPLLFEYFNKMSQIRLNTSFVDDPHFHTINSDTSIHPLLIIGDQNLQAPQHLNDYEIPTLLKEVLKYELMEDLLNFDDFRNTDPLLKILSARLGGSLDKYYNRIFPSLYFVPFEKIKPLSELFI